jgi:hypothetical protein
MMPIQTIWQRDMNGFGFALEKTPNCGWQGQVLGEVRFHENAGVGLRQLHGFGAGSSLHDQPGQIGTCREEASLLKRLNLHIQQYLCIHGRKVTVRAVTFNAGSRGQMQ